MPAYKVGLTGGMASGKSTVARALDAAGFHVLDADRTVAELYSKGQPGAKAVRELFGPGLLADDGSVDKPALARKIFADSSARELLERRIHPLVRRHYAEIAQNLDGVAVLEATRLVEAGYAPDFDLIVTVEADPEIRLRRAVERGMAEIQARAGRAAPGAGADRRSAAPRPSPTPGARLTLDRPVEQLIATVRKNALVKTKTKTLS